MTGTEGLISVRRKTSTPRRRESWKTAAALAVGIGVGFSVLLMSVAYGVSADIQHKLSNPLLKQGHLVNVSLIDSILALLTAVVTAAMLSQTAAATFTIGVTVTQSRKEEIALRRQSGVLRSTLLSEFLRAMAAPCLVGGVIGEALGLGTAAILGTFTVLPIRFTVVSVIAAFPVTVVLAMLATFVPAWRAANASPAMLRKG